MRLDEDTELTPGEAAIAAVALATLIALALHLAGVVP